MMKPNHEVEHVNDPDTYQSNSIRLLLKLICRTRELLRCYGVEYDLRGCVGELVFDIAGTFDACSYVLTGDYKLEPAICFRVEKSGVPGRGKTDELELVVPWNTSSLHEEVYGIPDMLDDHPEPDTTKHKISLEQLRSIPRLMGLPESCWFKDRDSDAEHSKS